MDKERISVRALVEFTFHGEDIVPAGSLRDMQEGMLGHKARQQALEEGWQAEVPLSLTVPADEETELVVAGRMDAYRPGEPPAIEEIKLWQGRIPPETPAPAHRMQAVVYGHLLCVRDGLSAVTIRVAYVNRRGQILAMFPEDLTAEACAETFGALLDHWLRRWRMEKAHARLRDAGLRRLAFPYESWRPGQREMAAQVWTAIQRRKRLLAAMPTGTGKSAAALYPALKALGAGHTGRVFYLTARTTQRQGPLDALARLREQEMHLWVLTLDAKQRQCPEGMICHPDFCPRAKGHYLRDGAALEEMLLEQDWTPERIRAMADRHDLCPFEFSLSLCELADLVICDYNYALDPAVYIRRIFDRPGETTLLIDEAHNLPDRVRAMLSGQLDGGALRRLRAQTGKAVGRKHPLYRAMTAVLNALKDLPPEDAVLPEVPERIREAAEDLLDAWADGQKQGVRPENAGETVLEWLGFLRALRDPDTPRAVLWRKPVLSLQALDIADHFAAVTQPMCGTVCFSATLDPLPEMKTLLGCGDEDACFSTPSPFPPENLLLLRQDINTRYAHREAACGQLAAAVEAMVAAHPGRYIAFFPSYAFMEMTAALLKVPFRMQARSMSIPEREAFLAPFLERREPCLALCVLGGVFAEGIDLPGDALDGVAVAGVGLPQVGMEREVLRRWHEERERNGFLYAYQLPGMQKVAQAVGRVIRSPSDRGVALLLDDRYGHRDYAALCPAHWRIRAGDLGAALSAFWNREAEPHTDCEKEEKGKK